MIYPSGRLDEFNTNATCEIADYTITNAGGGQTVDRDGRLNIMTSDRFLTYKPEASDRVIYIT